MTYGVDGPDLRMPGLPADGGEQLPAYSEDEDEAATQLVEVLTEPHKWIVQITPFDRRMLETAQLVTLLLDGALVRRDTLVWRGGMEDWVPIGKIPELLADARQGATLPPRIALRSERKSRPFGEVLAAVAIAISIATGTLAMLARGGVFEPGTAARRLELSEGQPQTTARRIEPPRQRREALRAQGPMAPSSTGSLAR